MFAVETRGLVKAFGERIVVDRLDLAVPTGAIYGFLGSNGAGKSTTIRMLLGLRRPTGGTIRLFGNPLDHRRRPLVGAMADSPGGAFYDHLNARDNLRVQALALGIEAPVEPLLDRVGLSDAGRKKVGGFSTGMRQRLGIARALVGDPPLVILDEPLNGLDPEGVLAMRRLLVELAEGRTMIICSHLLAEVEKVATHIGLLAAGRLLHQGPLAALRGPRPQVRVGSADDRLPALLADLRRDARPLPGGDFSVALCDGESAADLNRACHEAGIALSTIRPHIFDLEEFYHAQLAA